MTAIRALQGYDDLQIAHAKIGEHHWRALLGLLPCMIRPGLSAKLVETLKQMARNGSNPSLQTSD